MGGASSQRKGKSGERQVIDLLQPVVTNVYTAFGYAADEIPRLQRNTLATDGGGCDVAGLNWMALEVKFHKELAINTWWAQAVRQAGRTRTPILFYRVNKARWSVRMLGMLGMPSAGVTVPVTVDVESFLAWFRIKLTQELS
jgi:hypothetical protein